MSREGEINKLRFVFGNADPDFEDKLREAGAPIDDPRFGSEEEVPDPPKSN